MYKGFVVGVAGIPVQQIYVTVYEVARSDHSLLPFGEPVRNGIAAFLATSIAQLFNSPIDTITQVTSKGCCVFVAHECGEICAAHDGGGSCCAW